MGECLRGNIRNFFVFDNWHDFELDWLIETAFDFVHVQSKAKGESRSRRVLEKFRVGTVESDG